MSRPVVADILCAQGSRFLNNYQSSFGYQKLVSWVNSSSKFFLPVKALRRLFRRKFIAGLKRLYRRKKIGHAGFSAVFSEPKQFNKLVGRLRRQDWVVHAKPAFGGPLQACVIWADTLTALLSRITI